MPDQMPITYWPLLLVAGYLIGAIPFAQLLAKTKGVDLRTVGTENVGAGNLFREVSKPLGVAAALLDGFGKGYFPVLFALRGLDFGPGAAGLIGVASVIGHNWSIFMRGRSGRGLATSAGVVLALDPVLIVWTTGWAIAGWKIGSGLGGFLGWGLLPVVSAIMGRPVTETFVLLLLTVILMVRRIQGNREQEQLGRAAALKRALYDTDPIGDNFPDTLDEPLTP